MKNEIDRKPIIEAITAYQEAQRRDDFVSRVGNKVYLAQQLWEIIDQLQGILQHCEKCGYTNRIDVKDLY